MPWGVRGVRGGMEGSWGGSEWVAVVGAFYILWRHAGGCGAQGWRIR